jgi:hypothetical protein
MRNTLLLLMLIIIGERWIPHRLAPFNWKDGTTVYEKVYVIGEALTDKDDRVQLPLACTNCTIISERFVIPVPGVEHQWLKPEEAEILNATSGKVTK